MEKRVINEVQLSKPLIAVATIRAVGLFAIGLRLLIEATPVFAQSNQVKKIVICDEGGRIVPLCPCPPSGGYRTLENLRLPTGSNFG